MIRRQFMKFAPKEHDDKKVKKTLAKHNVPMFEGNEPSKFAAYGTVAKDVTSRNRKPLTTPDGGHVAPADKTFQWQQKAVYGGGTGGSGSGNSSNPYAVAQPEGNPYARRTGGANPYGASGAGGAGGAGGVQSSGNPYAAASVGAGGGAVGAGAYATQSTPAPRAAPQPAAGPSSFAGSDVGDMPAVPRRAPSTMDMRAPADQGYDSGRGYDAGMGGPNFEPESFDLPPVQRAPTIDDDLNHSSFDARSVHAPEAVTARQSSRSRSTYRNPALDGFAETDELGAAPTLDVDPSALPPPLGAPEFASDAGGFGEQPLAGAGAVGAGVGAGAGAARVDERGVYAHQPTYTSAAAAGIPLTRTQTNQTTASVSEARRELFGAAPQLSGRPTAEFDELNRTEMEMDPGDVLREARLPLGGVPEEDELNAMPSELAEARGADGYGGYSQQQLFEDSEDEDVDYVKREIRQTKQESVESTRRALQIAADTEVSGRNTLGMLGDQGERLGFAAKTVQLGNVQSRVAASNAEELQRLNRSIFIPNISNPFNSRRRNQMREQRLKSQKEYDEREQQALLEQQRESEQRINDGLNSSGAGYSDTALRVRQRINHDNPQRRMYQFEADSEDEELEDELEQNLEGISDAAKRLHNLSLRINDEVTAQNVRIDAMGDRVEDLDHKLHRTTAKMSTLY